MNHYLLSNVKETGVVNIINQYLTQLNHTEKFEKINKQIINIGKHRRHVIHYKYLNNTLFYNKRYKNIETVLTFVDTPFESRSYRSVDDVKTYIREFVSKHT